MEVSPNVRILLLPRHRRRSTVLILLHSVIFCRTPFTGGIFLRSATGSSVTTPPSHSTSNRPLRGVSSAEDAAMQEDTLTEPISTLPRSLTTTTTAKTPAKISTAYRLLHRCHRRRSAPTLARYPTRLSLFSRRRFRLGSLR